MMNLPTKIQGMIPHTPPMLLVDELLKCSVNEALVLAQPNTDCFFNTGSYLQGIAGVEIVAQSYAAQKAWLAQKQGKTIKTGYLVGVQKASLNKLPLAVPLYVLVHSVGEFEDFAIAEGEIFHNNTMLSTIRIKLWSQIE